MKKVISVLAGLCLTIGTTQADVFLGADAEIGVWFPSYSYQSNGTTHDLIGKEQSLFGSLTFEHPIPLIPNLKASFSTVDNDTYKYTKLDYTAYYEILDNNALSIDVGLGATQYESGEYLNQSFSGMLPHLYTNVEIGLPLKGTTLYGDLHYLNILEDEVIDAIAGLRYDINLGLADLGIKAGYRIQKVNLDDFDGLSFKLKTDGYFVGLHLDF